MKQRLYHVVIRDSCDGFLYRFNNLDEGQYTTEVARDIAHNLNVFFATVKYNVVAKVEEVEEY